MEMSIRPRRLRKGELLRKMVRETTRGRVLSDLSDVCKRGNESERGDPDPCTGQYRYTVDRVSEQLDALLDAGVTSVMLFGIPDHKDEVGSSAWAEDGIIQKALRAMQERICRISFM